MKQTIESLGASVASLEDKIEALISIQKEIMKILQDQANNK